MLSGIDPVLTGELLWHLDAMGHSDDVVLADAHFPAGRLATRLVNLPGLGTPEVLRAIRTVVPADDGPALCLMASADGAVLPVHEELIRATGLADSRARYLDRQEFYDAAQHAYLIVRTGEQRTYGNALFRKGLVLQEAGGTGSGWDS